jgi:hypothetical protein
VLGGACKARIGPALPATDPSLSYAPSPPVPLGSRTVGVLTSGKPAAAPPSRLAYEPVVAEDGPHPAVELEP